MKTQLELRAYKIKKVQELQKMLRNWKPVLVSLPDLIKPILRPKVKNPEEK